LKQFENEEDLLFEPMQKVKQAQRHRECELLKTSSELEKIEITDVPEYVAGF
jgi:hypothetical protein